MSNLLNIKDQNGNWIPIPVITNGIQSITQNQDYTLTITLNDGTTYTTTSIKGEDGQDYILTENDKQEIAQDVAELVDIPVEDVQINGASIVSDRVAEIPIIGTEINSTGNSVGLIPIHDGYANGFQIMGTNSKWLSLKSASETGIKNGRTQNGNGYGVIDPTNISSATFYGLAKSAGADEKNSTLPVGQYTESAKSAISSMLNTPESVSGMTPTITAKTGVRYICGECTTLDITTPESGIVDITFTSGATPTVLTVTPPTGMTMMWANGFDSTALEANTVYEINIMDGCKGVVCSWT